MQDHESLSIRLLSQARELLPLWLPGGRFIGNEYSCNDFTGGKGDGVRINTLTGAWNDYNSDDVSGDNLLSLYATIYGIPKSKAYDKLTAITPDVLTPINQPDEYQASTIQTFIGINTSMPDEDTASSSNMAIWERCGISITRQGQPVCNLDNGLRVLQNIPEFNKKIWFDEFHNKIFTDWNGQEREWSDGDDLVLTAYIQRSIGIRRMTDDLVRKAVILFSRTDKRNEPKDWFNTITWDGIPRISKYMTTYLGAVDSPYLQAVSRNWWISMIARVMNPGCQMRHMVILEGKQETGKSKSLATVGGRWYCEAHEDINSNNFFQILQARLIVEIGELQSFSRAGVTRIKQVVSCSTDRYRAPYARLPQDNPRTCVFVGTTNEDKYLDDPTGSTRFWPVATGFIRIDNIARDREQLYAEAVAAYKAGETYYITPPDETITEQESRRRHDEWEEAISEYLIPHRQVTVGDIWKDCLKMEIGRLEKSPQMRIAGILRSLGWIRQTVRSGERIQKVWSHPNSDSGW